MDDRPTISYASPQAKWRGVSLGNGIVGAFGGLSAIYTGLLYLLLLNDSGFARILVLFYGAIGGAIQAALAVTLGLIYFLRCRRLQRGGEIFVMGTVIGSPIATGIAVVLAIVLPNTGGS